MKAIVIIPARYASTRFPGKPLAMIHGKPMIQWVYENAKQAKNVKAVYIATDDERIAQHIRQIDGNVLMTHSQHPSGTDRVYEAYQQLEDDYDVIINVQGDEPYVDPDHIDHLVSIFDNPEVNIATLIKKYRSGENIFDENKIRVVINTHGKALYFSRSAIPFVKNQETTTWQDHTPIYQHIGMYAYRPSILKKLTDLPASSLEKAESLEQLRWLENGHDIHTVLTESEAFSIDTPEDLEKLLKINRGGY